MSSPPVRFLVVGDIHGHWSPEDAAYLEDGDQDLTLFVGDLGDENFKIVRDIAAIPVPKAVILGNHDAWQSFSRRSPTEVLRASVTALGDDHLAYGLREVPEAGVSILGARPFSWGGADIRSPEVYQEFFGLGSMRQSAQRIVEVAGRAQHQDILILAHNGPLGLGSEPEDIYGKDFRRLPRGDWGDQDLAWALERIADMGLRVRAVIAGHMHDRLGGGLGLRTRFVRMGGTSFLNPAVVPRIRRQKDGTIVRHFMHTDWRAGELVSVEEIWVDEQGRIKVRREPEFAELPCVPAALRDHGRSR